MNTSKTLKQEAQNQITLSEDSIVGIGSNLSFAAQRFSRVIAPQLQFFKKRVEITNGYKLVLTILVFGSTLLGFYLFGSNIKSALNDKDVKGTAQKVWTLESLEEFDYLEESFTVADGIIKLNEIAQSDGELSGFGEGLMEGVVWDTGINSLMLSGGTEGTYTSREFKLDKTSEWSDLELITQSDRTSESVAQGQLLRLDFNNAESPSHNSVELADGALNITPSGNHSISTSYSPNSGNSLQTGGSVDDYLISDRVAQFGSDQITNAFWVNTVSRDSGILSYSTEGNDNEWLLYRPQSLAIYRGDAFVNTQINIADGEWHHVAVLWSGESGSIQVYVDGSIRYDKILAPGTQIEQGGILAVGNDQDQIGGGFKPEEAFLGRLDDLMIWNRRLSSSEIIDLYEGSITSVKYQIRGCDDVCDQVPFAGPDGTELTYYQSDQKSFGRYLNSKSFQYKLYFESSNGSVSPKVFSATVGPKHFGGTEITLATNRGVEYEILTGFSHQLTGEQGNIAYQLSPDGSNWYFWNGVEWKESTNFKDSNSVELVASKLPQFGDRFGPGLLYFKAIFINDPLYNFGLDSVQLEYSPPKGARVSGATDTTDDIDLTEVAVSDFEIQTYDYFDLEDEIIITGFVSDIQRVSLYSPDGETLVTERVQGKWEIVLPEVSERLGAGKIELKLLSQNEDEETTAYEDLVFEIPPEIPGWVVIAIIAISLIVTGGLIFTIVRDKSPKESVLLEEGPKVKEIYAEEPMEEEVAVVEEPVEEVKKPKVEIATTLPAAVPVVKPSTERRERTYTIEDYINKIVETREKEQINSQVEIKTEPTKLGSEDVEEIVEKEADKTAALSRKAMILKNRNSKRVENEKSSESTDKVEVQKKEEVREPIMKSLVSLGAYSTSEKPFIKKTVSLPEEPHVEKKIAEPKKLASPFSPGFRKIS